MTEDYEPRVVEFFCSECGERPSITTPLGQRLCPNRHWVYTMRQSGDPAMN